MKTASGIKRFQEDRGSEKWFNCLLPLIQTRASCQPELALEPSSAIKRRNVEMPTSSSSSASPIQDLEKEDSNVNTIPVEDADKPMFVPIKRNKK